MSEGLQEKKNIFAGAPPFYSTQVDLAKKIQEYFDTKPDKRIVITKEGDKVEVPVFKVTGLAFFLGFESRQSIYDYSKRPEFSYTIKRAVLFIEREYEIMLESNPTAAIFALKNFGWTDTQKIDSNNVNVNLNTDVDYKLLTDDELETLDKIISKASVNPDKN